LGIIRDENLNLIIRLDLGLVARFEFEGLVERLAVQRVADLFDDRVIGLKRGERSVYKWVPVCGAGRGRLLRSISAAFAAALWGTGVGSGLTFTEFRRAFAGGLGGRP
jgi:hypothetical protein